MADNSGQASGGIGFVGMLTILFIGLKLADLIQWSWWWVLSPLWISAAIAVFAFTVVAMVAALGSTRRGRF